MPTFGCHPSHMATAFWNTSPWFPCLYENQTCCLLQYVCFYSVVQDPEHCINKLLYEKRILPTEFQSRSSLTHAGSCVENRIFIGIEKGGSNPGEAFLSLEICSLFIVNLEVENSSVYRLVQVPLLPGGIRTWNIYFSSLCLGQICFSWGEGGGIKFLLHCRENRHFDKWQRNHDEELNELLLLQSSLTGSVTRSCPLCSLPFAPSWTVISGEVIVVDGSGSASLHVSVDSDSNVKCAIKERGSNDHLCVDQLKGFTTIKSYKLETLYIKEMQHLSAALCKMCVKNHSKTLSSIISYTSQWSLRANTNILSWGLKCPKYIRGSKSNSRSLPTFSSVCFSQWTALLLLSGICNG